MRCGNYYNEHDAEKAEWLRELIRRNVISKGQVDERDIQEVAIKDLRGFSQCHFFAGIGVWSYALRLAGWPDDRPVWTGSCPCPSFSAAGKGGGFDDSRHLWPDWARLIRLGRPATIFGEQADDAIGYGWLDLVQTDLEREDYAVGKAVLTAAGVGAPHARERLYFVAHVAQSRVGTQHGQSSESAGRKITTGGHSVCGKLAHSESERCGEARSSRGRQTERPGDSGEHGELADSNQRGQSMHRAASGEVGHTEHGRESSGLENAHNARSPSSRDSYGESKSSSPDRPSARSCIDGLGDPSAAGLQERERDGGIQQQAFFAPQGEASERGGYVNGFWRDADWVLRKRWNSDDFEWCPTEPRPQPMVTGSPEDMGHLCGDSYETFPLASKVKNRVLKLRGYGDAIVAPLAAAFIGCCMEVEF